MVPVVFCITILFWSFILGLFTVMDSRQVLTALLDGRYPLFLQALGFGILNLLPLTISLALVFVFFHFMRHPSPWWLSVPFVLALCTLSITVLIPLTWRVSDSFAGAKGAMDTALTRLTDRVMAPGFIRRATDGQRAVWFIADSDGTRAYPVITVNDANLEPLPAMTVYPLARYDPTSNGLWSGDELAVSGAGGADSLLSGFSDTIPFLKKIKNISSPALDGWRRASELGFMAYYATAGAFFLAVLALWPLSAFTGWRLLNMVFTIIAFGGLYAAYPELSSGEVWRRLSAMKPFLGRSEFVGPLCYVAIAIIISIAFGVPAGFRLLRRKRAGLAND